MSLESFEEEYADSTAEHGTERRSCHGTLLYLKFFIGRDSAYLQEISSTTAGGGTKALNWPVGLADKHQIAIEAHVRSFETASRPETITDERLVGWYCRFGFELQGVGDVLDNGPITKVRRDCRTQPQAQPRQSA